MLVVLRSLLVGSSEAEVDFLYAQRLEFPIRLVLREPGKIVQICRNI